MSVTKLNNIGQMVSFNSKLGEMESLNDIEILIKDDKIEDIGFKGVGCAISKASGSMMTDALKGKTVEECLALKDKFLDLVTQDKELDASLGKLKVFEGVKQFPVRVKCAALVWRALEDALEQGSEEHCVSTE